MYGGSTRNAHVIIATAVIAAVGLFLLVVNLAEHLSESRVLVEAMLFVPLLLCSAHAVHARRS